jgi:hypothetical protein
MYPELKAGEGAVRQKNSGSPIFFHVMYYQK